MPDFGQFVINVSFSVLSISLSINRFLAAFKYFNLRERERESEIKHHKFYFSPLLFLEFHEIIAPPPQSGDAGTQI